MEPKIERRKYKRAFFTLEDKIPITVIKKGMHAKTIAGTLLSICEGGVGFVAKRHEVSQFEVGNRLTIFCACLPQPVSAIKDVEVQIRHIVDLEQFAQVSIGCMFDHISQDLQEKIAVLVKAKSKGTVLVNL